MGSAWLALLGSIALAPQAEGPGEDGTGNIRVTIRELGRPVPARVTLFTEKGEPAEVAPVSTGRTLAARRHVAYLVNGSGTLSVPAGRYDLIASRGMEYSIAAERVEVKAGGTTDVTADLVRQVDTSGYVAADFHVPPDAGDGGIDEDRIISATGEGLGLIITVGENRIVDGGPAAESLGVGERLRVLGGAEVVIPELGHFGVFPLDPGRPIPEDVYATRDPALLFERLRGRRDVVIQVSHPRSSPGGYFIARDLDPDSGSPGREPFSRDFDGLEMLSGSGGDGWRPEPESLRSVRTDWFHLLHRGLRKTAVAGSGSHGDHPAVVGLPRTYIASAAGRPAWIEPAEVARALREGRAVISGGIYVQIWANGLPVGSVVRGSNGVVRIRVRVQAPHWVPVDRLDLFANGERIMGIDLGTERGLLRCDRVFHLRPERDTWYVAAASSGKALPPIYPDTIKPIGITNPVWVDQDGDGTFQSGWERARSILAVNRGEIENAVGALRREAPSLRALAATVLGEAAWAPEERFRLLDYLADDTDEQARRAVLAALLRLGDPRALPTIHRRASVAGGRSERAHWMMGAIGLGDGSLMRDLAEILAQANLAEIVRTNRSADRIRLVFNPPGWQVLGPFADPDGQGLKRVYGPERSLVTGAVFRDDLGRIVPWQDVESPGGVLDLGEVFKTRDPQVAFGVTHLHSPGPRETLVLAGSDEGLAVWVNGAEVYRKPAAPQRRYRMVAVPVWLKEGRNELRLETSQILADWRVTFRVVDLGGTLASGSGRPRTPGAGGR